MQHSSESIAQLATALAKAQTELTNPEKSLVGMIEGQGSGSRLFRYAPLSSGLEIVRKTLGQHELAVIQATAVDHTSGTINLTTTLAHKSGEWISSDWPVCRVADTATPRKMGAALTYARRYALFTLVGIAGEDDVDAPDIQGSFVPPNGRPDSVATGDREAPPGQLNRSGSSYRRNGKPAAPVHVTLAPAGSAELRDKLIAEIANLRSHEDATSWARRVLGAKNTLTSLDSQRIEADFRAKLAGFSASDSGKRTPDTVNGEAPLKPARIAIDKSALTLSEPRRRRNKEHLKFLRTQPCLVCGKAPSDAHHVRYAQPRALGRKVSDEFTVPVCRVHHRQIHGIGDEFVWWKNRRIDPLIAAQELWAFSHEKPSVVLSHTREIGERPPSEPPSS